MSPSRPSTSSARTTAENNIKVWCRIWLDNYALKGTTLMSRSGGNYAGRFDLKKDGDAYTVTAFDAVKDGSDSAPSEKAIFGIDDELMAGYQESDADVTDCRVDFAHMYAEDNGITIEAIQDFGWRNSSSPTRRLPATGRPRTAEAS